MDDGGWDATPGARDDRHGVTRRSFLGVSLGALSATALPAGRVTPPALAAAEVVRAADADMAIPLHVNGQERRLRIDPRVSLLDALRDELALTGTKKGCDHGQCGACTVLVDDRRVLSCLTLAAMASGHRITTIEGLAEGGRLHAVQEAFIKHDALQCGFCTPGQIMSAVGLLREGYPLDAASIRECMSGNLCRCGAYPNIVTAIQAASGRNRGT